MDSSVVTIMGSLGAQSEGDALESDRGPVIAPGVHRLQLLLSTAKGAYWVYTLTCPTQAPTWTCHSDTQATPTDMTIAKVGHALGGEGSQSPSHPALFLVWCLLWQKSLPLCYSVSPSIN